LAIVDLVGKRRHIRTVPVPNPFSEQDYHLDARWVHLETLASMGDYAQKFRSRLWRDAKPWARDNIVWTGLMVILPPVATLIHDAHHPIDWEIVSTTIFLYALAGIIYIGVHAFKTARKLDAEHVAHIKTLERKLSVQVSVTELIDGDPRIEPMFVDGRKHPIASHEYFELKNKGKSPAHWVRFAALQLRKRPVYFREISEVILPTDSRIFEADIGNDFGYDGHPMFIKAFNEEWASYEDYSTRREIFIPARIDFEGKDGIRFECNFTILYHGGKGWNQPADFKCVECRDFSYRRIPPGVTPLE
jgi:hypothetical protein